MGIKTNIQWCDSTVNPSENCDGCELWNTKLKSPIRKCYAGKLTERWKGAGAFDKPVALKPGRMAATLKWQGLVGEDRPDKPWLNGMPRVIFVDDMADLFSKAVPFEYIEQEVIDVAFKTQHIYLMLTKQAKRMMEFVEWYLTDPAHQWPVNVWLGVSVTSPSSLPRIDALWSAKNKVLSSLDEYEPSWNWPRFFVSYGPVLEAVDFSGYPGAFDWLIIEGESGSGGVRLELQTVRDALAWCRDYDVTPFVKQMGTAWAQEVHAADSKGGDMSEWPEDIRVREMPIR